MNNITLAPVQTDQPSHLMPVFGRQPISFVRGRGAYLYTEDGTEYLDALTGIAVCGLGHAHPVIAEAIAEQAATLIHTSNLFEVPWQTAAAQKLAEVAGMEEVFFSNSGAESNEGAIKIARKFGHMQGIASPKIIVADKSFHGRTLATLSATGNKKFNKALVHWLKALFVYLLVILKPLKKLQLTIRISWLFWLNRSRVKVVSIQHRKALVTWKKSVRSVISTTV